MLANHRPADPLGLSRVVSPKSVLPQQAEKLDASLPIAEDELLIDVEALNIDSASFHQIKEVCSSDPARMEAHISELVKSRGKHHNPVTGSGGMLIGRVRQVGARFPVKEKPVKVGDRVATLVSLTLTPLEIRKIKKIHLESDRVEVDGHAILFASGLFARLPEDLPENICLAALDVAGAPAQTRKLVERDQTVVVIGGAGKSGVLCLYEAKRKPGVRTIAVDYSERSIARLRDLGVADEIIQADARDSIAIMKRVSAATAGKMADVVINVANIPDTEMSSILSARQKGVVYFFSMATSFTRAALGAEGLGRDLDLRIGNGYTEGHADLTLGLLRESPKLKDFFLRYFS